ncbi:aldo/keto reductase [Pseudomarimonas salicorniae]|uniref:Aldo/keto reductase n=1 Tax=Pseudomarimonas salicorniae TaxID=2933270 RepID=A0ABT0GMH0_9GAMM|nr:aldo/keto reductase [Lysobacter sp. CAU 1642]MCK7595215.1 aldo/keto reductase [Lysobacter sp. CAU 1642]
MNRRPLGRTGRHCSELGFGCASWWAQPRFSEREAIALVHAAMERGVEVFDTGPSYGDGCGEQRLGRALQGRARDDLLVITKAGTEIRGGRPLKDFSPRAIRDSVERSRRRLGLDRLPALLLHGCPAERMDAELIDCLATLRAEGKVDLLGLNSFDAVALRHAARQPLLDLLMLDYSVLRPERAALVDELAGAGKAVIAAAGLGRALYALDWTRLRRPRDLWYWLRALGPSRADWQRARALRCLGKVPGWNGPPLALRWALQQPRLSCVLFNTTRMQHLVENLDAARRDMPLVPGLPRAKPGPVQQASARQVHHADP